MASSGPKRTRAERVAALGVSSGALRQMWRGLGQRGVLIRAGLALLATIIVCIVIRAWTPPMPFRADYTPPRDINARAPFEKLDKDATKSAQEQAYKQARLVYKNDPERIAQLRAKLHNQLLELSATEDFTAVDPKPWTAFELPLPPDAPAPDRKAREEAFRAFRQEIIGEENLTRIEKAVADALAPLERQGLLSKAPEEGNQKEILVYRAGDQAVPALVPVSDVLLGNGEAIRAPLANQLKSPKLVEHLYAWLHKKLTDLGSTLTWDQKKTEANRAKAVENTPEVFIRYEKGQTLAKAEQPLRGAQLDLLRREHAALQQKRGQGAAFLRAMGVSAVILGLFAVCALYFHYREPRIWRSLKRLSVMLLLIVLTVGLARLAAHEEWHAEIVPVLLLGQIVAIAYRQELALLLTGAVILVLVLALGLGLGEFIILMGVTTTAVLQLGRVRTRGKLTYVGLFSGLAAIVLTVGVGLVEDQPLGWALLKHALRNGGLTLATGFLMHGILPLIERLFGVLTDMSLLELGDVTHPLLQELVRRAPSTYNHSVTVGTIAEAAADAIGARGLLVRVGAYFHDLGKMLKPGYFIENQGDEANRHETLMPAMSTLVIIAHIKDGANLARQHHLPEPIIDFILQHHGTTLVGYFFERAKQEQNGPDAQAVDESTYRYPGPKPQTKEAAVLMLADAVESASRTLVEPTPARIESLVREISKRRLQDGQFDESGLTLRELRTIEDSMIKSVTAIYHGRVKYPDQRTA
ncbi:MAG: HDIG domain-containing protein [Pirellulales bacterium]|nr:HDIG domain-containing protein [Pirellulales bacterium]